VEERALQSEEGAGERKLLMRDHRLHRDSTQVDNVWQVLTGELLVAMSGGGKLPRSKPGILESRHATAFFGSSGHVL